jgi:hypothetical protein
MIILFVCLFLFLFFILIFWLSNLKTNFPYISKSVDFLISKIIKRFVRGSPRSVLLAFSQSYVEHNLRKNKIVIPFFC